MAYRQTVTRAPTHTYKHTQMYIYTYIYIRIYTLFDKAAFRVRALEKSSEHKTRNMEDLSTKKLSRASSRVNRLFLQVSRLLAKTKKTTVLNIRLACIYFGTNTGHAPPAISAKITRALR